MRFDLQLKVIFILGILVRGLVKDKLLNNSFLKGIPMLNAFIIVLREGFEAFLIVAIIFSYLRKTGQRSLTPAVYAAIVTALTASVGIGYWLNQATEGVNQALWE